MIYQVFAIYDAKVEAYNRPFYDQTKAAALRGFADAVNDPSLQLNKHPEDYTLFHLGEWEDGSASFTPLHTPVSLGVALEYLNSNNEKAAQDYKDALDGVDERRQ